MTTSEAESADAIAATDPATRRGRFARTTRAPLDEFRIVAGAALLAHFAQHFRDTVPLLAWSGLYDPRLAGEGWPVRASWLGGGLSPTALHGFFALAMALAAAVALGIAPRACSAVLYGMAVLTYWAIFPIAELDDCLANATTLYLALMPVGASLCVLPGRRRPQAGASMAVTIFLGLITVVYLTDGLGTFASDRPLASGLTRLIPIAFVLPVPGLRLVGIALQMVLHGYWIATTHDVFANVVLAASGLLFWGQTGHHDVSRRRPLDAGAIVGAACAAILVFDQLMRLPGPGVIAARSSRVVADLGLLVDRPFEPDEHREGRSLAVVAEGTGPRERIDASDGRRARRLLAAISANDDVLRLSLAASVARRHCLEQGYWGQVASLVATDAGGDHRIIEFECGADGALSALR